MAADIASHQVQPPHCPDCGAVVLYECPACSSTNYPPPEAAQVQPDRSNWSELDRIEFALRDAGFDLDDAFRIAHAATHPAVGDKVREELDALREFYAAWRADNATGPSQRRLAEARDRVEALAQPQPQPQPQPTYTTGHCENHKKPGGCPLHNLHCGWPECDRKPIARPQSGEVSGG